MQRYEVNNGTQTKMIEVFDDPKRSGLLFARHFNAQGQNIGASWGKRNQARIQDMIRNSQAA